MAEHHRKAFVQINIKVTPEEYLKIRKRAMKANKPIKQLLVQAVLGEPVKQPPPLEFGWPNKRS